MPLRALFAGAGLHSLYSVRHKSLSDYIVKCEVHAVKYVRMLRKSFEKTFTCFGGGQDFFPDGTHSSVFSLFGNGT